MPSDVFRPRLPLDPFANIHHNVPWRIPAHLNHSPSQVIFILGEPLLPDLLPLLHSPHLAQSLLLIATHAPLALPTTTSGQGPAVRVLRLAAPLHVHDTGALRLVSLFERAQRVAVLWRSHRGNTTPHVLHLAEDGPNGEFVIVDTSSAAEKYPSPASSFVSVKRATSIKNRLSMLSESLQSSSRSSVVSLTSSPKKARRSLIIDTFSQLTKFDSNTAGSSPSSPSSCSRSFDAIVNFLPSGLPDKALFKHSILVTTLSAQYLALPFAGADTHTHGPGSYSGAGAEQQHAYHYHRRSSSPPLLPIASPTPLSLSHLPSFASSSSASASSSSASSSASLSLSTPPKAKTNDPIRQRHHRRFSSFALASHASSSSIPDASGASGDESPALRPEWRSGSSYGLSSASASGASTAVTTPATSPGWELSRKDDDDECEDDDVAQKMTRRKSMKKRLSSLFASVSRPVSISSAAELGTELEMGLLGASASADADAKRRARPQNAHIVHVLPADWTPPPPANANANAAAAAAASPYAKARAPANTHPKPPAKPKLVQGIEQFLLGFAYPLAGLSDQSAPPASRPRRGGAPPPSAYNQPPSNSYNRRPQSWGSVASAGGAGAGGGGQLASLLGEKGDESFKARAVPYLVAPGLFGRTLGNGKGKGKEGEWGVNTLYEYQEEEEDVEDTEDTEDSVEDLAQDGIQTRVRRRRAGRSVTLGEAVLLGALDLDADTAADASGNRAAVGCGRAWIAEGDVELVGGDAGVVEVRRSRTVRRKEKEKSKDVEVEVDVAKETLEDAKEKDTEKENANAKEASTTSLGLPTPPRSQRSSVTSSSAGHSDSAEGEGGSASSSGSGELTRSNSSGSCSEAVHQSEDVDASQVQVQVSRNTITSARASVIAIPPRAAPRRESSESTSSVLASGSTSKVVVGGVPMSRSPSSSGMKAPHYVPVRLLAQQQQQHQAKAKSEAGVEVSVTLPRAVHLLGGGGGGGSGQSSTTPAPTTARPAEEVQVQDTDGVPLSRPGPDSVPSANPNPTSTSTVVAPTPVPEAQAKSKSKKLSLKLKAPALLREQTKAKITKERPASMVVLGDRSHAHVRAAVEGEGGRERKRSSYGVLFLGNALRRVTQGLGSSVFGARAGSAAGGEKE